MGEDTSSEREAALQVLSHNLGFSTPELWVDYAIQHGFKRVAARPVPNCPDCGRPSDQHLGQYVHYSTLIHLKECRTCHLIWADAHIDPATIRAHFERAYKDHEYFVTRRVPIFRHLAGLIDQAAPRCGRVLDVGGAQGHLMHLVASRRPDLRVVVHDLSESATRYAAERFGLQTIGGGIASLRSHVVEHDVVVLSDVLYYEPDLATLWSILPRLVAPNGTVIIRVPNKLPLIRAAQALARVRSPLHWQRRQHRIRYFNPEHIYILSRRYLTQRLAGLGFVAIGALPSPFLAPFRTTIHTPVLTMLFRVAAAIGTWSHQRIVLTPSMVLIATRQPSGS